MIPRVRPFFHERYIESVNKFESNTGREQYLHTISQKLESYYPNAEAFEFFDYGRSSLSVGLSILDFQENDEILVPCFTCSTVLEPIISKKLKPVLYDIEFDFSIDIDRLIRKLTSKTRAIIITHFFGIPSNIIEIKAFADSQGISLIEDCAHSIGSKIDNIVLGNIGDFSFTSLGNDKPLSIGNGSFLILNNKKYLNKFYEVVREIPLNEVNHEKCSFLSLLYFYINTERSIYNHFIGVYDYYHYFIMHKSQVDSIYQELKKEDRDLSEFAQNLSDFRSHSSVSLPFLKIMNYFIQNKSKIEITSPKRMNCFSMNILNAAINHIKEVNLFRKKIGMCYTENLFNNNDIIAPIKQNEVPFLRYSIINKNYTKTAKILKKLKSNGYECGNFNWEVPLNKIMGINKKFENSEFMAKNIINLPCHFSVDESDVFKICEIINQSTL